MPRKPKEKPVVTDVVPIADEYAEYQWLEKRFDGA